MILDGCAMSGALFGDVLDPRSYLLRLYPRLEIPELSQVVLTAAPLVARVNHGHWIASCPCGARGIPTPGCVVWFDGPGALLGWCARCQNGATGRGWRAIVAPSTADRAAIEAVLICRPLVSDRNWEPSETVADLWAQNVEHGCPVPPPDEEPPDGAGVPSEPGPQRPGGADAATWRALVTPFSPLVAAATSRLGRLVGR